MTKHDALALFFGGKPAEVLLCTCDEAILSEEESEVHSVIFVLRRKNQKLLHKTPLKFDLAVGTVFVLQHAFT